MRVTNTASFPRAIAYAGDRNLAPGATSAELPFSTIMHKTLLKDLEHGMIALRLSDPDKQFIGRMLEYDKAPVVVKTRPNHVAPRPASSVVVVAEPVPITPPHPPLPRHVPFTEITKQGVLAIPEGAGKPSLADLKRMNDTMKSSKLDGIKKFMGSMV